MKGRAGKILEIELSRGSLEAQPLEPEMGRLYLGGRGLGERPL